MELTLSELAQFNGKDGNPAYVAVDGVIYDVTNLPKWKNGEHNGYSAGQDLTDIIKNKSPHGVAKLKDVPVVGKLIEG
ncbi:MAG: cytochrome b5 domain-containing protein [Christensenella sp.]